MAVDGAGNLYFAIQNGDSIFSPGGTGSLLTSPTDYPAPYNCDITEAHGVDAPCDLAFDANGNLYATFFEMAIVGSTNGDNDVLIEFGANGDNSVVAANIGGTYIAVQPVPEPGIWTFVSGLAAVLGLRPRRSERALA
jgi:hypothetical protein